ncbi:VOC family protein [Actinosynnema sp. NPDC053489]|uniref:VOC family protein n=1 Tax=Actinosynnema sp. NPDC053489 TaxID=3363916 RepID=UPI0037C57032
MAGVLQCVVLDCPEPRALAAFYQRLLGGEVDRPDRRWSVDEDWSTLHAGGVVLAFQRAVEYVPPEWPDPRKPQQFHLDIGVGDLGSAKAEALDAGGTLLDDSHEVWWVFADPAGHPFCLVRE